MKTEIITITDRSGSMGFLALDVIGGFNKFLADQQAQPGDARMTFTQFDNEYETVYQGKPLSEAPQLTVKTYIPRGATALLDAIGRTLNVQGARIKAEGWAELVIICIITDGAENASHEFTRDQIKEMVKHAEEHGWKFIYLTANIDAWHLERQLGGSMGGKMNFTHSGIGTQSAYGATGQTVSHLRGGGAMVDNLADLAKKP